MKCDRKPDAGVIRFVDVVQAHGKEAMVTAVDASDEGVVVRLIFDDGYEGEFCDYGSDILIYERVRKDKRFVEKKAFLLLGEPFQGHIYNGTILLS